MMKKKICLFLALLLAAILLMGGFCAPYVMEVLFWEVGRDPAVAVLQGGHLGNVICMAALTISVFILAVCFIMEHRGGQRTGRNRIIHRIFYVVCGGLCAAAVSLFWGAVFWAELPEKIAETGRDLAAYRSGRPAIYKGPLLLVDRQLRDGIRQLPDERFVYYDTSDRSLRCAASLLSQPHLMQASYTVTYLPETGTILTITDADGNLRTAGKQEIPRVPRGCWMYYDLAVPVCNEVEGYSALTSEQKALFDLMYSEVLSSGVSAGEIPTRSFDLPYPLEKEKFNAVLELYEASVNLERPDHGYRTDDGQIVSRAYCYGITYAD